MILNFSYNFAGLEQEEGGVGGVEEAGGAGGRRLGTPACEDKEIF